MPFFAAFEDVSLYGLDLAADALMVAAIWVLDVRDDGAGGKVPGYSRGQALTDLCATLPYELMVTLLSLPGITAVTGLAARCLPAPSLLAQLWSVVAAMEPSRTRAVLRLPRSTRVDPPP